MSVSPIMAAATNAATNTALLPSARTNLATVQSAADQEENPELREAFDQFVGETLFGQMLKSMRKTVPKSEYFHGGRGEDIFQQQLDQVIAEKIAQSNGGKFSGAMYALFTAPRP